MRARAHHRHRAELGDVSGEGCEGCLIALMATAPRRSEPETRPDPEEVARLADYMRRPVPAPSCWECDEPLTEDEIEAAPERGRALCAGCAPLAGSL